MKYLLFSVLFLCAPFFVNAQEAYQELKEVVEAEVLSIVSEEEREIMGTDTTALVQTLRARIKTGVRKDIVIEFDNDLVELKEGDQIFLNRLVNP